MVHVHYDRSQAGGRVIATGFVFGHRKQRRDNEPVGANLKHAHRLVLLEAIRVVNYDAVETHAYRDPHGFATRVVRVRGFE